jgi:hypothetical protein
MQHVHHVLNLWAVLACAALIWVLGALWFSPALFAKPWVASIGRQMGGNHKAPVHGMVSSFIGDIFLALVLAHFVVWSHADNFGHGAFIGFLSWLGFIAAVLYPQRIYEGRPFAYFAIVAGYWLIGLLTIGGILAIWR